MEVIIYEWEKKKKSERGKLRKLYHVLAQLEFFMFPAGKSTFSNELFRVKTDVCSLAGTEMNSWT